jgi:alkanesulfonate monooxygenase SsuD/methylene tetrahydromethanopterin reductase-like flavin-dependent oxidoreductase (luciferase family)
VHVGILHQMWAVSSVSDRQCIEDAVADVQLAEALGYESFWFGEHHFSRHKPFFGRVPVPELLIARLAAETRRIRLGTGVKVLPLDTAARFAEKMALLDLLTDQRSVFGIGEGTNGELVDEHQKGPIYRRELTELLAYLRGEVDDGRPPLTPAPERDLSTLLWAAVRNADSVAASARAGINLALGQIGLATDQRVYVDRYRDAGGTGEVRAFRLVLVAETEQEALRLAQQASEVYYAMLRQSTGSATATGLEPDAEGRRNLLFGTPSSVAGQVLRFKEECAVDRVDLLAHVPGLSHDAVQQTLTLFAREVAPLIGADMLAPALV